jgi:hypothetical protein
MSHVSPGLTLVNLAQLVTMPPGCVGLGMTTPLLGWVGVLDVVRTVVGLGVKVVDVDVVFG